MVPFVSFQEWRVSKITHGKKAYTFLPCAKVHLNHKRCSPYLKISAKMTMIARWKNITPRKPQKSTAVQMRSLRSPV